MIVHLTGADRQRYPAMFREMHRQRHETYVVERGWQTLSSWRGEEIDQFDRPDAQYLFALERCGNGGDFDGGGASVAGALRLLPTHRPHLLSEVLADFAPSDCFEAGPRNFELTRFYVAPAMRQAGRNREMVARLSLGLFEHAQANGIEQLVSVVDLFLLPRMRAFGWVFREIGPRRAYAEGKAVAVSISPNDGTIAALRTHLKEIAPHAPLPPRPLPAAGRSLPRLDLAVAEP